MKTPTKDPRLTAIYWPLFDRFEALAREVGGAVPKLQRMTGDDRATERLSSLASLMEDIASHLEDGEVPDYIEGRDP